MGSIGMKGTGYGVHRYEAREQAMGSIGMKGTGYGPGSIGMKGTGYGVHWYEGNRLWGPLV